MLTQSALALDQVTRHIQSFWEAFSNQMTVYLPAPLPSLPPSPDSNPLTYRSQDSPVPSAKGRWEQQRTYDFSHRTWRKQLDVNLPDKVTASSCFTKNPDEACFLHLEQPQSKVVYLIPHRLEKRQLKRKEMWSLLRFWLDSPSIPSLHSRMI